MFEAYPSIEPGRIRAPVFFFGFLHLPIHSRWHASTNYNSLKDSLYLAFTSLTVYPTTLMVRLYPTIADLETQIGAAIRACRLDRNIDQATLAARAGVSLTAFKRLEAGRGSTLRTLVSVLRALSRESWLDTLAPVATINPLTMPQTARPRQRARKSKG